MSDKKTVWIDTDLSVGMKRYTREGYSDVDDGYAIAQLFAAKNIHIPGVSAVFGNTKIDDAFRLCNYMVDEFADRKIPVFKGAGVAINRDDVKTNDAVEGMAAALREEKMIIMAIGPATNVGLLILLYPELVSQITEVVLVAGRRKQTDYFAIGTQGARARDLNFDLDNLAFRIMFENHVSVTLCPFEISSKVWIDEKDLEELSKASPACQWLAHHSQAWLTQWKNAGASGFNPFDVLASHYILHPQDIVYEDITARLELNLDDVKEGLSENAYKNYLLCDENGQYKVRYCYDVVDDYHLKLLKSLK